MLKSYKLPKTVFMRQGIHSFFLVNIEPVIYILFISFMTFTLLTFLRSQLLKGKNQKLLQKERDREEFERLNLGESREVTQKMDATHRTLQHQQS